MLRLMPNTGVEVSAIHVVAAVIWHPQQTNTILITQRPADKHLGGYWELPGGKKEAEETPTEALGRELFEEVGIQVVNCKPLLQVTHNYPDKRIFLDVWQVMTFSGEAVAKENQAMVWASITQLDDYEFPEADVPVLEALRQSL